MATDMNKAQCYNCGNPADTREHVIAKTLIQGALPDNLITVPACKSCNAGFSKDEEYFRDRLSACSAGLEFEPPKAWETAWRSMKRPEARGKKMGLFKDVFPLPAPGGAQDGSPNMGVRMDKKRMNRVIEKIVRGFYFHHFKKPLGDVDFEIDILSSINPTGDRPKLLRVMNEISPSWVQNFGDDTHAMCALFEKDDRAGLWSFKFFGQHIVAALVTPKLFFETYKGSDNEK